MLAVLGGAGGLVLAGVGVRLLAPLPVIGSYTHPSPQIDYRVLVFTVVAVLLTTVLFGLLPVVRNHRGAEPDAEPLCEGSRSQRLQAQEVGANVSFLI